MCVKAFLFRVSIMCSLIYVFKTFKHVREYPRYLCLAVTVNCKTEQTVNSYIKLLSTILNFLVHSLMVSKQENNFYKNTWFSLTGQSGSLTLLKKLRLSNLICVSYVLAGNLQRPLT